MDSTNHNELCYKTRIGPWHDKEEFLQVYKLLFSPSKTRGTQQLAFDMMTVWKLRRHDLTPASVLSTLAILEVQLRDYSTPNDWHSQNQLRIFYSTAFTRFLNYMSSIMQNGQFKSMYETAKELGIESFIVDLRHLCAHGQVMPTLETFRRTALYCLTWLHGFYWSREIHVIHDACPQDIQSIVLVNFQKKINRLFSVYDLVTESIRLKCRFVEDVIKNVEFKFDQEIVNLLELYSLDVKNTKLTIIMIHLINDITTVAQRETRTRGNDKIYCSLLFKTKYFMLNAGKLSPLTYNNNSNKIDKQVRTEEMQEATSLINMHQNLFRSIAICGLIPICFKKLLEICENEHEINKHRSAAAFWANQIATGLIIFKQIKKVFKDRKEKNDKFKMDLTPVNTDEMTKDIKQMYKKLNIDSNGVLIFGDTISHPWSLDFDAEYLSERFINANEFTIDILNKCLILSQAQLNNDQQQHLKFLLSTYMAHTMQKDLLPNKIVEDLSNEKENIDSDIYSLDVITMDDESENVSKLSSTPNYGIWSEVSDDYNWKKYPLGRLPWQ